MDVELWYDPVGPETRVRLDGRWTDSQDGFGFLYPVRSCLLQTWLAPGGSWTGLRQQLAELARGEPIALAFHGRALDFADLDGALSGMERLTLSFCPWEAEEVWGGRLEQAECLLGQIMGWPSSRDPSPSPEEDGCGASLYPELAQRLDGLLKGPGEDGWLEVLENEEDLSSACGRTGTCCLVDGTLADSYDQLGRLKQLTRSMRRSPDMICCRLSSGEEARLAVLTQYAAALPGMGFRFDCTDGWRRPMWGKYGHPFLLRVRRAALMRAEEELLNCMAGKEALRERRSQLAKLEKAKEIRARELAEQEQVRKKLHWIERKAEAMSRLGRLLHSGAAEEGIDDEQCSGVPG